MLPKAPAKFDGTPLPIWLGCSQELIFVVPPPTHGSYFAVLNCFG
jgi:hypothetical protein